MPVNMSYCRNQNTLAALKEIFGNDGDVHDFNNFSEYLESLSDEPGSTFGNSEREAAVKLVKLCCVIADDFGDYVNDQLRMRQVMDEQTRESAEFRPPGVTRLPPLWGAARFYRFRRPFGLH